MYQIRQKVIEQLQKTYSYYAWQANVHQARRDNLCYIPIAFARYAQAFFLWQIGFKALDTYLYWEARNACADQKNTFSYWDVTAQYECTVCDWLFVQYRNALSAQGCLDSLFSQKLNATQIADYLVQFKIPRNFSHFDLSAQPWQKWTSEEFDLVLTKAEAVLPEKIATLGIYSDETHEISPPLFHMQRLGKFLQKVQTEHIVARNENLDAELIQPILEASCNSTLKEIDLTNNSLGDESTAYLGTLVATTSVEVLIVENVGMTAVGVQKIVTTNNRLTRINLIENDVDSTVLVLLANNTVQNQLQVIELGVRPLSADGLKQFCERIYSSPSHLNSFAIRNVPNFTDKHCNAQPYNFDAQLSISERYEPLG